MSEFNDVAALFSSQHSARILSQHRSSVSSVDGDSEARSLPEIDINPTEAHSSIQMTQSKWSRPHSATRQLAELETTRRLTNEEIMDILAHELNESDSSESDDSSCSSSSDASETVIMKVLIVGSARCGKTSTIQRFIRNNFREEYVSTIGADFEEKVFAYDDQLNISLQLWDIAGQDRFAKFTRGYFREAKGAVIVCDITRANTLDAVVNWKHEIDTCCQELNQGADIPVVMIANKSDLLSDPMDALDLGVNMQKCVDKNNIMEWFRTSAKSGEHIDDAFRCLIDRMAENYRAEKEQNKSVKDDGMVKEEQTSKPDIIRLSKSPPQYRAVKQHGFACDCN